MKTPKPSLERSTLSKFLRSIASLIDKASDEEFAALLNGSAVLSTIHGRQRRNGPGSETDFVPPQKPDLGSLSKSLHSLSSRDEGMELLKAESLNRRELEGLARILDIPILKTDNVERLSEKVIEASIGSRLNSEAVRGERASQHS